MGVERGERDRRVGRMHDVAWTGVENGEVLILARLCGTSAASVLETGNRAAVVPAARTLAEIPADRPHVAERRRSHDFARGRERGKTIANALVRRDVPDPRGRADAQSAFSVPLQDIAACDRAEIDQRRRSRNPFLDADEEIGSSAKRLCPGILEELRGLAKRSGAPICKGTRLSVPALRPRPGYRPRALWGPSDACTSACE